MRVSRSLGSSGAGDCIGECSPDSKIRFMPGSQGLPVSFNIFNALMLPRQLGRSLISLFCIERTRRAFIDSNSSGTSVSLFRLISSICNWVSPNICNLVTILFQGYEGLSYGLRDLLESIVPEIQVFQSGAVREFVSNGAELVVG